MSADELVVIDESMSQLFSAETHDQLERLIEILLNLEASPDEQSRFINEMFRIAHNIKGSSGMMGLNDLKELMHSIENMFDGVRKETVHLEMDKIDLLLDLSRQVMAYVEIGNWSDPGPFADWKNAISETMKSSGGSAETQDTTLVLSKMEEASISAWQQAGNTVYGIEVHFAPESTMPGATAIIFTRYLEKHGNVFKTAPDVAELIEGYPGAFKIVLMVEQALTPEQEQDIGGYDGHGDMTAKIRKWVYRPERAVAPPPKPEPQQAEHQVADTTIRVEFTKIDKLINDVQALLTIQSTLVTLYERGNQGIATWNQIGKAVRQLEQTTDELQVAATSLRMVPVRQLFCRFPMIVRDVAKKRGKTAEIKFFGEDTEIDKRMAEQLINPLTHIIRNAVDHGLETPEQRKNTGKASNGTVTMGASQEGDRIVISVGDDGQGLNPERIWTKAIQNGLIKEDEILSKEDIFKLIFRPGFSTAEQVSDISGRGVGLDVVKEAIASLKGDIEIESEMGRGSTFRLRVPLTLAIIQTFMCKVGGQGFGIPLDDVIGSLLVSKGDIKTIEGGMSYRIMDDDIPVVDVGELLGFDRVTFQSKTPLVIVKHAARTMGLLIDEMIGQDKVILKQINGALENNPLISGAAFLSNGDMALILNIQQIFKRTGAEAKEG